MPVSTIRMQESGTKRAPSGAARSASKPARRSQRVSLRMPIVAFAAPALGHSKAFEERTFVARVSAHGGQIELAEELSHGDRFMLRHAKSTEETECRVVNISKTPAGKKLLGFEFTDAQVDFWRMSFPPPGARPILEK